MISNDIGSTQHSHWFVIDRRGDGHRARRNAMSTLPPLEAHAIDRRTASMNEISASERQARPWLPSLGQRVTTSALCFHESEAPRAQRLDQHLDMAAILVKTGGESEPMGSNSMSATTVAESARSFPFLGEAGAAAS